MQLKCKYIFIFSLVLLFILQISITDAAINFKENGNTLFTVDQSLTASDNRLVVSDSSNFQNNVSISATGSSTVEMTFSDSVNGLTGYFKIFSGDMYFINNLQGDNDDLRFRTKNIERMTIKGTGEVVMTDGLEVAGDILVTEKVVISDLSSFENNVSITATGSADVGLTFSDTTNGLTGFFKIFSGDLFFINMLNGDDDDITFRTKNTQRMAIKGTGEVIIGSGTTSDALLDVQGTAKVDDLLTVDGGIDINGAVGEIALDIDLGATRPRFAFRRTPAGTEFRWDYSIGSSGTYEIQARTGGVFQGTPFTINQGAPTNTLDLKGDGDVEMRQGEFSVLHNGLPLKIQNTVDANSNQVMEIIGGNRATPTDGDEIYMSFMMDDSTGTQREFARLTTVAKDVTSSTIDARLIYQTVRSNILVNMLEFDNNNVIFNKDKVDVNLNVLGTVDGALLFVNAGTNRVGISTTVGDALLHVDGRVDEIQFLVQGYSTQTNDIFIIEQSDGTDVFNVNNAGDLNIAGDYINNGNTGFTGTCTTVTYTGGIATSCNDI